MSTQLIGAFGITFLVVLTLLRVPLGAAMGLVGLAGRLSSLAPPPFR